MKRVQSHPGTMILRHEQATNEIIRTLKPMGQDARLLCFGSSWGAEVLPFALQLPEATIVAAEIEQVALDHCAEIFSNSPNVHVIASSWEAIESYGPFDAITSNAVLCKFPQARDLDNISAEFSFAEFEDFAGHLERLLNDDGLWSQYNSNYSLLDSALGRDFEPFYLGSASSYMLMENFVGQFDKDGNKRIHVQSRGAAFAIEVTNRLETTDPSVRKSVAKEVNQGFFVKNPSPVTAVELAQNELLFDMDAPDPAEAIRFDHNAVYRVVKPHKPEFTLIPLTRWVMNDPAMDPTSPARLQESIWWDDQVIRLPVSTV